MGVDSTLSDDVVAVEWLGKDHLTSHQYWDGRTYIWHKPVISIPRALAERLCSQQPLLFRRVEAPSKPSNDDNALSRTEQTEPVRTVPVKSGRPRGRPRKYPKGR